MKSIKLFMIAIALILAFSVNLVMAQETFDSTAAEEEGYWYSRYNLGNLVMRSVMGETFMPDMQTMVMAMKMVDTDFDESKGFFSSQNTYTIDDVAIIIGALNAMRIFESADVDTVKAEEVFTLFFDTILNQAGMQQSAPPLPVAKSKFEYEGEPEIYFRHPDVPFPPMAGGEYGIAPVFASSVTYRDGKWEIDRTFDAAGAMHAANEMIWLHHDEVDGFPIL